MDPGADAGWKPSKWIAALVAFLFPPIGMLYVYRPRLAWAYFAVFVAAAAAYFWFDAVSLPGLTTALSAALGISAAVHAYILASRARARPQRPAITRGYSLVAVAACGALAVFLCRSFLFEPFRVPSQSMFTAIPQGSNIIVRKLGYGNYGSYGIHLFSGEVWASLQRGDIVVFEYPLRRKDMFVMRLVGLPGDHVSYIAKRLSINGTPVPLDETGTEGDVTIFKEAGYKIAVNRDLPAHDFEIDVEPGHLFLLGDNRDKANDSRFWGTLPIDHVVGKVVFVHGNHARD